MTVLEGLAADLTARERQIVVLVADGLSNVEIGQDLYLSPATIKAHLARIVTKLDAKNRTHLVAVAFRRELIA